MGRGGGTNMILPLLLTMGSWQVYPQPLKQHLSIRLHCESLEHVSAHAFPKPVIISNGGQLPRFWLWLSFKNSQELWHDDTSADDCMCRKKNQLKIQFQIFCTISGKKRDEKFKACYSKNNLF